MIELVEQRGRLDGPRDRYVITLPYTPNHTFDPNRAITRAEMTRMLYRIVGSPDVTGTDYNHPLTDIPPCVDDAVRWTFNDPDGAGPVAGRRRLPRRHRPPQNSITRGQVTRVLRRL